jgi:glycogen debranching enzyme
VRWADGTVAARPLALCEVQGYAHEAALGGAALLDAFGRPGAAEHRRWARELADRFRRAFWVTDAAGPHPAIALDGAGRPVTGAASTRATCPRRGCSTPPRWRWSRSASPAPTWTAAAGCAPSPHTSGGFAPLGYHLGTVWPHDTAIAALGLAAAGHGAVARSLAGGLVAAAADVADRLPELYGVVGGATVPYPTACRPRPGRPHAGVAVADLLSGAPPPGWAAQPDDRLPPGEGGVDLVGRDAASRTSSTAPSRVAVSPSFVVTSRRLRVARGSERW